MIGDYSLFEYLGEVTRFMAKALHAVTSWKRTPSGHVLLGRSSHQGEDELGLVQIAAAGENRFSLEHLTENASATIRNERGRITRTTERKRDKLTQLPTCQSLMYTGEVVIATLVVGTIL